VSVQRSKHIDKFCHADFVRSVAILPSFDS
jgi:hypothetical protein